MFNISNAELNRELKDYLETKYKKVHLTSKEVEKETLSPASEVPSTSGKQNTWLILDVVSFINSEYYNEYKDVDEKRTFV